MNFWAIGTSVLLGIINWFVWGTAHIAVLQGGAPSLPFNIFHLIMKTVIYFLLGYGINGVLLGCIFAIFEILYLTIIRIIREGLTLK